MRKVIAMANVPLDGVMQAPGHPDQDTRGGFAHGGWALPTTAEDCGARLHVTGRGNARYAYECTARIRGILASAECKPAPAIAITAADALVSAWFLARYGSGEVMRKIYDPGTGHAARSRS